MKKLFFIAVCAAAVFACSPARTTRLSGTLAPDSEVTEVEIIVGQLDTTVTVQNRSFSIEVPVEVTSVSYAFAGDSQVRFVSDGSSITFNFEGDTAISDNPKGVHSRLNDFLDWKDDFDNKFEEKISKEGITKEEFEAIYEEAADEYFGTLAKLIRKNSDNVIALLAASEIQLEDSKELLELLQGLSPKLKEEPRIDARIKALEAEARTAEGQPFTDFEVLQDPEDSSSTVRFSDYIGKGKYVLVDFWASWCGPCRREMPNIRAVYEKFAGPRFDILSVAVWDSPEETLKAAEEEKIAWNQIINAQRIPTEIYGIQGIPHIILFGPDGTILKRGLRGEAIAKAVEEALDD